MKNGVNGEYDNIPLLHPFEEFIAYVKNTHAFMLKIILIVQYFSFQNYNVKFIIFFLFYFCTVG